MPSDDSKQIFFDTREQARRLCDILNGQEADLVASGAVDPEIKEAGLSAIRRAIESARRLADRAERAAGGDESASIADVENGSGGSPQ
ncbi:MAG TPA: hypothetical protein VG326_04565 [Tepidisphaeraceae bacterium]|nr:hypothetical protein [Tepidisphaeraceae bacterium]